MDRLQECARAFEKLLDTQYNIVIGRKMKTQYIHLSFQKSDFAHLMGLHKLRDIDSLRIIKREHIFERILEGSISYYDVEKSIYFKNIVQRFEPFSYIEKLLDDNRLIFQYNEKTNSFSLVEADYLLATPHNGNDIYIFIDKDNKTGKHFCRSFFPKSKTDYTLGQSRYTLLYKEKVSLATGEKEIQYDKLSPIENVKALEDKLQNHETPRIVAPTERPSIKDNLSLAKLEVEGRGTGRALAQMKDKSLER